MKKLKKTGTYKIKRIMVKGCWLVAAASFLFGVYKNFTATDRIIEKETETVVEKVENYSGLEAFTENFAKIYFAYSTDTQKQTERRDLLKGYMQPSLVDINSASLYTGADITVNDVQVWGVEAEPEQEYEFTVYFTVVMTGTAQAEVNAYTMGVYCEDQEYVITKNPRITSAPQVSDYERQGIESSGHLTSEDREAVGTFLETFFEVYPSATAKELAYYVKDSEVKPIGKDYTLVSIDRAEISAVENGYEVSCYVTYKDNVLDVAQVNGYEMDLAYQEDGELVITDLR